MSKNIIWHPLPANPTMLLKSLQPAAEADSVNVEAPSHWNPEPVFLNF